jgi:hypothetical protein
MQTARSGTGTTTPEGHYRVLYASTEREATFRESVARYRADPASSRRRSAPPMTRTLP